MRGWPYAEYAEWRPPFTVSHGLNREGHDPRPSKTGKGDHYAPREETTCDSRCSFS
jgi:hypothetical protein